MLGGVHWDYVLLTGVWGALTSIERRAFLQAMISRPIVAATITGLFLHHAEGGLLIGVLFELLYLGEASMGAAQTEHETLPAITAAAMVSAMADEAGTEATPAMLALAVLLFAPVGRVGRRLEAAIDARAIRYADRVDQALEAGDVRRAVRQNLRALWPQFVFYGLTTATAALMGFIVVPYAHHLPNAVVRGLAWAWPVMGVAAAAVALHGSRARSRYAWAVAASLASLAFGYYSVHGLRLP